MNEDEYWLPDSSEEDKVIEAVLQELIKYYASQGYQPKDDMALAEVYLKLHALLKGAMSSVFTRQIQ